ncbi:unnamed protein product [Ambrosiozyma monospora]|uniref:Unnamed protein product n=1 Tax=Ambrosiozyma monospora TaxID=43982 RepID=A0ACB5U535_AMBMO|nr:unnamed protein product [Ambrosiozyma monospora]
MSENTHLLVYAFLWLSTPPSILKIFPFTAYSFLNLSNFFTREYIPQHPFSKAARPLLYYIEDPLLILSAHFDVAIIAQLLYEAKQSRSIFVLGFYVFIWELRVEHSDASRIARNKIFSILDSILINDHLPGRITNCWIYIKRKAELLRFLFKNAVEKDGVVILKTEIKGMKDIPKLDPSEYPQTE